MRNLFLLLVLAFSSMALAQEPATEASPAPVADETPAPEASVAPEATAPAEEIVPLDEAINATVALVKDYKSMGKLGAAIALLNLLIMLLKTQLLGAWFSKKGPKTKRLLLVVFGQAMGILLAVEGGMGPLSAVIAGLITSGGAMAIYEAYKAAFKKT